MGTIIFYIFGAFALFSFYLHAKAQKILKAKYPQIWLNLGEPEMFIPQKDVISKQIVWNAYLKNKEYLSLRDHDFERLCNFIRVLNKASYLVLVAFFASMYFFFIKPK